MSRRKYDITKDGYRIRGDADFDRVDISKSERKWKHRKAKLEKRRDCDSCEYIPPDDMLSSARAFIISLRYCAERCVPEIINLIEGMEKMI